LILIILNLDFLPVFSHVFVLFLVLVSLILRCIRVDVTFALAVFE
jgi:hypothetical protein